jgi:TorA maturation chaperone TorD
MSASEVGATGDPRVAVWLERSATWLFASLVLQPPEHAHVDEMARLVPLLPAPLQELARDIVAVPMDDWEPEFFRVLGPGGCPACESSYERAAAASRGPLLSEIAACYSAFGYAGERLHEVPDHVAVELGFLSFLALKVAFARFDARGEDARVAEEAYSRFARSHVTSWIGRFTVALGATNSACYARVAALVTGICGATAGTEGPSDAAMPLGFFTGRSRSPA